MAGPLNPKHNKKTETLVLHHPSLWLKPLGLNKGNGKTTKTSRSKSITQKTFTRLKRKILLILKYIISKVSDVKYQPSTVTKSNFRASNTQKLEEFSCISVVSVLTLPSSASLISPSAFTMFSLPFPLRSLPQMHLMQSPASPKQCCSHDNSPLPTSLKRSFLTSWGTQVWPSVSISLQRVKLDRCHGNKYMQTPISHKTDQFVKPKNGTAGFRKY